MAWYKGGALSPLLFYFALKYAIRPKKFRRHWNRMNGT
jgi:hypothetical protein